MDGFKEFWFLFLKAKRLKVLYHQPLAVREHFCPTSD